MSTIVTDTITGKSTATTITIGSTPVVSASANSMTIRGEGSNQTSIQQGLAKSWMNLNGQGTIATRDSFNIGSLTDNGTGDYTITLSTSMNDGNYKVHINGCDTVTGAVTIMNRKSTLYADTAPTSSQYRIATGYNYYTASAFRDNTHIFTDIHGDLA